MTSAYDDSHFTPYNPNDHLASPTPELLDEIESATDLSTAPGKRSVRYLRVSSRRQMDTDSDVVADGNSIDSQRKATSAKEQALGLTNVDEYIEPGSSGQSIAGRPEFQRLLRRIVRNRDIDYVVVDMRSRAFRNFADGALIKRELAKLGVKVISAHEDFGEGIMADAMEAITDIFNEVQVRLNGQDIKNKMRNKALNGGTVGRAPLGYLNVRRFLDGKEIRTVATDPERAPLIRLAFELYATGDWTLADLNEELYDRGLRTRPTPRRPARQVSESRLSQILRDRYYLGYVTYDSEEIEGRHEPLVDEDLFEHVQDILEAHAVAGERRRVHHHYLKGTVFCGYCWKNGVTQRLVIQQVVKHDGSQYSYFFCRRRRDGSCTAPHIGTHRIEEAVAEHYRQIRFSSAFIAEVREHINQAIADEEHDARLLRQQLTTELQALDTQEDNLIELATSGAAQAKIKTKLRQIERHRQRLRDRLTVTNEDLSDSARLIDICLRLLEDPHTLYQRCDDHQRRLLNQAVFHAIYVEEEDVAGNQLQQPFARLHGLQEARRQAATDKPDPGASITSTQPDSVSRAASRGGGGPADASSLRLLLDRIELVQGSNKTYKVGDTGFEPVTSSV
ncbi:recombinase family protein [Actinomadura formosensis]|uniref:recombinase family protein n=1 Tax=Actinomadura formosensis TaxID=60706 RepID=UPI0009FCA664